MLGRIIKNPIILDEVIIIAPPPLNFELPKTEEPLSWDPKIKTQSTFPFDENEFT